MTAALAIAFYLFFAMASGNASVSKNVTLVASCLVLFNTGHIFFIMFAPSFTGESSNIGKYAKIVFKERPNVHLISFDSMTNAAIAKEHMDIDVLPHSEFLKDKTVIVFKNMFASNAPTMPSLHSVMLLADPDGYVERKPSLLAGQRDSPLSAVFRSNSYKIATGYPVSEVLGQQGAYVDEFRTAESSSLIADSPLCEYSSEVQKLVQFFGFCKYFPDPDIEQTEILPWSDIVIKTIAEKGTSESPWLTFHYIYNPIGHTAKDFRSDSPEELKKYRSFYLSQSKRVVEILKSLLVEIDRNDPNSIVFIFGDHGPWLSRRTTPNDEKSRRFFTLDRYGVYGALVKTNNPCATPSIDSYRKSYTTPERVIGGIIRCLSRDPEYVDTALKFKEVVNFNNFLYE